MATEADRSQSIFLSRKSEFAPGKPIRGGVPIAFPWFATRHDGKPGPSHGFARIQDWTLGFAALVGDDLHLTFTLGPTEMSRHLGYDNFRLAFQLIIGRTLTMQLTVGNDATVPLLFEEALHTYYAVADIHEVTVAGLEGVTYLDKNDSFKQRQQQGEIIITEPTDRVYLEHHQYLRPSRHWQQAPHHCGQDRLQYDRCLESVGVRCAKIADLDPTEWHEYLAVETVNAAECGYFRPWRDACHAGLLSIEGGVA